MKIERKVKEFRSLSKVVDKADIENVFLKTCNVWRKSDALKYNDISAEVSFDGKLFKEHKNHFSAKVIFSLKGLPGKAQGKKEIINLTCEYILTYSLEDKDKKTLTTDDIKSFCNMNAIYNAWPYMREFVQSMFGRMEIPTLTLPLLKFRPPKKKVKDKIT